VNTINSDPSNTFLQIKRRIYLSLIPVFFVASIFVFFTLITSSDNIKLHNYLTFSLLAIGIILGCFFTSLRKKNTLYVDLLLCFISAFLFLFNFYRIILFEFGQNGYVHLGPAAYWVPLIYLLFFFSFKGKVAFNCSLIMYFLTLIPGIYHLVNSPYVSSYSYDTLLQFYIASFGFIACLYFFQKIFQGSAQLEIDRYHSITDFLTNLPNRRKMDLHIQEEITKANKDNYSLSVILFDVDHFKRVNDTYGHNIGDEVLKELAKLITTTLPEQTYFGRWGGEEFIIVAANKNKLAGAKLAENLRIVISEHRFSEVGKVTCSFGVAELEENDLTKDVVKRADEAQYLAKESGRNQVRIG
jgi:diguanylate cyclase (GGDEF)-like protein